MVGEDIKALWSELQPHIAPALERDGTLAPEDVFADILERNALAWVVVVGDDLVGVLVTRVALHPAKDVLEVITAGGERFWEWAPTMQRMLERYVYERQLDCMRAYCRPGMGKWLKRLGWKTKQEVLEHGR